MRIVPPSWLDKTGKELYKKLAPEFELNPSKIELLAILCESYSMYRATVLAIAKDGRTVATGAGSVKVNPELAIQHQAHDRMIKTAKALGLTSVDDKIQVMDELEDFASKRGK